MNNFKKYMESGRSMVEMLGVLAIIGVLSVGGISGYKYAMIKWTANETIAELNLRAHEISFRMDKMIEDNYLGDIEMDMGNVMRTGYPIAARISPLYYDYFEVFIDEVPSAVCRELLRSQWRVPYSVFVGVEEYEASEEICNQAEKVELAYEFYRDLSEYENVPEERKHKIQRCRHDNHCQCGACDDSIGLCRSDCSREQSCIKTYDDPRWMDCCDEDKIKGGFCCSSVTEDGQCCNDEGGCCPPDKPLRGSNGTCYSCDYAGGISLTNSNLCSAVCPKRYLNNERNAQCVLCGAKDTSVENKVLVDYNGNCYSCDYEGGFDMGAGNGSNGFWNQCTEKCPGERYNVGSRCYPKCPDATPLRATDGGCYACDDTTHSIPTSGLAGTCGEDICSGTRKIEGNYCVAECPEKTIRGSDGKCYSCEQVEPIHLSDTSTCSVRCPKRHINTERNAQCVLCGAKDTSVENKVLVDYNGNCYSCDYEGGFDMGGGNGSNGFWNQCTEKCPGERYAIQNMCYPACSGNTPIQSSDWVCHDCNYNGNALTTNCDACANREVKDGACVRSSCTAGFFESSSGECYNCKITTSIAVNDEESCTICLNRKYEDGYCIENS